MTHSVIGKWVAEQNARAFLEFKEDGSLSGSDGANRIVTTWTDEENGPTVKPSVSTLMAAPNMVTWVTKARRVEPDGRELKLYDSEDNNLGVLIRDEAAESPDTSGGRR
ncbi:MULTISPECIES: META domain-containing protein [unclassified Brevibacterium]|uniref:META domain-containing protein n=1 Tax=unclassified Brevibacterium TaxID=2614124 RepID=UPI001E2FFF55|nr:MULTISPECIES: META domain-containing protein [unclassified Brevibacterium]MCD1284544.1 hypothetical protein [Brevibacterium sp. CCUG 69071]MDK8435838.1 META domain-containing protein [Brevibacterium sp. H-BE7]